MLRRWSLDGRRKEVPMFKRLAYSLLTVAALVSATVSGPARAEDATPSATACTGENRFRANMA